MEALVQRGCSKTAERCVCYTFLSHLTLQTAKMQSFLLPTDVQKLKAHVSLPADLFVNENMSFMTKLRFVVVKYNIEKMMKHLGRGLLIREHNIREVVRHTSDVGLGQHLQRQLVSHLRKWAAQVMIRNASYFLKFNTQNALENAVASLKRDPLAPED